MRDIISFFLVGCLTIVLGIVAASEVEIETPSSAPLPLPTTAAQANFSAPQEAEGQDEVNVDEVEIPIIQIPDEAALTPNEDERTASESEEKSATEPDIEILSPVIESPANESSSNPPVVVAEIQKEDSGITGGVQETDKEAGDEDEKIVLLPLENIIEVLSNSLGNSSAIDAEGTGIHNSYSYPQSHGHGHQHQNHYHQSYVKPLKPSVVHRDPHAHFDEHDAVRTQDYDRQPHHHQNAHGHKAGYGEHPQHYGSGHGHGHRGSQGHFQPYHYDTHQIPACAHENRRNYNLTFCLEDHYYPTETIQWALRQYGNAAQRLLSDVTYQSADNLVDGLTRTEEEGYTYSHYYGASQSQQQNHQLDRYKPPYSGYSYSQDYYKKGGYICPSDIFYGRPRRAMNTYGKWKVIVNLDYAPTHGHGNTHVARGGLGNAGGHGHSNYHQTHTQTLRLEQCIYSNAPCSYIDSHYYSRCLQKHNFVRLVAWTYEDGLHIDNFKMPIACSCHIQQPVHYYTPQPHHNVHHPNPSPPAYGHGHGTGQALLGLHQGKANVLTTFLG